MTALAEALRTSSIIRGPGRPEGGYRLANGEKVASVTTVLGMWGSPEGLVRWAGNIAYRVGYEHGVMGAEPLRQGWRASERERDEAAAIGTAVHDAIEEVIHGADPFLVRIDVSESLRERAYRAFDAWCSWHADCGLEWAATEVPLVSERLRYAGTVDAIAMRGGERFVIDHKTSSRSYATALYQCAAYAIAWEETTGEAVDGCIVVRADKMTGEYSEHCPPAAAWAECRKQWTRILRTYHAHQAVCRVTGMV